MSRRFVIVTGMSGAGKTTVLKFLEDADYFCVDNLPIDLIGTFIQLIKTSSNDRMSHVALGLDIRSGENIDILADTLNEMNDEDIRFEILFLDAGDDILIKRYKETRRFHPLSGKGGSIEEGIIRERKRLEDLKKKADFIIDTSHVLTRELRKSISDIFVQDKGFNNLMITIMSFGFKAGIPAEADLVFDVRFLPNPYYIDELKKLSGNDPRVSDYVMSFEESRIFADKLEDLISFLLPSYIKEGKTQLIIAIGCTGGRHRSVTLANELYRRLGEHADCLVRIEHRDLVNDIKVKGYE